MEHNLPPMDDELGELSERLQEYNQTIQEQAFLLGYRNGFREGELVKGLVRTAKEKQADAERESTRLAWQEVEHWLIQQGAFLDEDESDGEITHPPGLNCYVGAFDCRPHLQVAGQRIGIEDFQFDWDPAPEAPEGRYEAFEPQAEAGEITIQARVSLPEASEEREELLEFLNGLR